MTSVNNASISPLVFEYGWYVIAFVDSCMWQLDRAGFSSWRKEVDLGSQKKQLCGAFAGMFIDMAQDSIGIDFDRQDLSVSTTDKGEIFVEMRVVNESFGARNGTTCMKAIASAWEEGELDPGRRSVVLSVDAIKLKRLAERIIFGLSTAPSWSMGSE